jgi:hypothetical protein
MRMRSALVTAALLCLAIGLPESNALAKQKQQVSFKVSAANSKYIVSQNVDVGDVPNHIVRLFDVHSSLPNAATINGLKLAELFIRGTGEIADGNGSTAGYFVLVVENGDKLFARNASVVQSVSGKITATTVGDITGGTGRLAGIRGVIRSVINFDPSPGGVVSNSQFDIDYSIGK